MSDKSESLPSEPGRREFLKEAAAIAIGATTGLVPAAAGLTVLLDPLTRKTLVGEKIRVTTLDAVPNDGIPRKFPILASRTDAWNKFPDAPVGAVYLRRTGENSVLALNVVCPHAGCFVDFKSTNSSFYCPCHNSSFGLEGKIADPKSPSPRAMDELEVEIRNGKEIWVKFQNFRTGHAEKVPMS
jgi:menaquinol-cytochrome c reductase iron-sulfur subunit